jgi:hypothetical protein
LDLAFNNFPAQTQPLKAAWLEKGYVRYGWWIYVRPVIDHPEIPSSGTGFVPIDELEGKRRIYVNLLQQRTVEYVFPKHCLIDTQTGTLYRLHNKDWHRAGTFSIPLWL